MDPIEALEAREEAYLGSLTAAEAEGDERAIEAAPRPRPPAAGVGQNRAREPRGRAAGGGPRGARPGARGGAQPGPGPRPRAAVRSPRPRQDDAGDDRRPR